MLYYLLELDRAMPPLVLGVVNVAMNNESNTIPIRHAETSALTPKWTCLPTPCRLLFINAKSYMTADVAGVSVVWQ